MATAVTRLRQLHIRIMCENAHRPNAHIIGWRVTRNTPRGSAAASAFAPGMGSAGLPAKEPASRTSAGSITVVATIQPASPEPARSAEGAAWYARITQANAEIGRATA